MWAAFAAHVARFEVARRAPWFASVLLLPQLLLFALLFAGGWSSLYLTTIEGADDHYGPLWWVSLGYSVITSYSIHYTKLYDATPLIVVFCSMILSSIS